MQTGTISRYWHGRGFGFVAPDDGTGDIFLHVSVLHETDNDPRLRHLLPGRLESTRVEFTTKPRLNNRAIATIRMIDQ